jgi:hypothetical protein
MVLLWLVVVVDSILLTPVAVQPAVASQYPAMIPNFVPSFLENRNSSRLPTASPPAIRRAGGGLAIN